MLKFKEEFFKFNINTNKNSISNDISLKCAVCNNSDIFFLNIS